MHAATRAITLPPKLDKAHTSYTAAGAALTSYAAALAQAQADADTAIRAAATAQEDLVTARTAQAAATAADARAVATALATGAPIPTPIAPRYTQAIDDAIHRLARARAANTTAHQDHQRAAKIAATGLAQASRKGIANKHWWQHALSNAGHWAGTAWSTSLRLISTTATTISAIAGIAALVVAVVGIICPPLEAVAAVLETVSLVSGAIGAGADLALAATGKGSWTTLAWDTLALGPWAAAKATTKLTPLLHDTHIFNPTTAHASTAHAAEAQIAQLPSCAVHQSQAAATLTELPTSSSWANQRTLGPHFGRHGPDFESATPDEYAAGAAIFLQKAIRDGAQVKIDPEGVIRVFDPASNTFGSYNAEGRTRTFFKPKSSTYWSRQPGNTPWSY